MPALPLDHAQQTNVHACAHANNVTASHALHNANQLQQIENKPSLTTMQSCSSTCSPSPPLFTAALDAYRQLALHPPLLPPPPNTHAAHRPAQASFSRKSKQRANCSLPCGTAGDRWQQHTCSKSHCMMALAQAWPRPLVAGVLNTSRPMGDASCFSMPAICTQRQRLCGEGRSRACHHR